MTQPNDYQTQNVPPAVEIQPTLKMASFIQYLQNNPIETPDDYQAAIESWDDCGLTLGNGWEKKEEQL